MKPVKKRGRKPTQSYLLSGDKVLDETRLRGILAVNGKKPVDAARDMGISESAISQYLQLKRRSKRFFLYVENLSKLNNITVQRTI